MKASLRSRLSALVQRRIHVERRGGKRVEPMHRTLCLLQMPGETSQTTAIVQNLSLKGIGVHVDREYTVGATLDLLLVNASHTFSVTLELKVVRCFRAAPNLYFVAGPFTRSLRHEEVVPFIL
ncbi:MAG TPA: PilZ domain-containing protein [Gemmataceae bacterium]|nr:PilZ domain-containing protein [Gemmataceae bacterium]